jgi:protein gp37
MKNSKIEWTDHTFNPWWGCEKVSPACAHCYAEAWARRTGFDIWGPDKPRRFFGPSHWNEPYAWDRAAKKEGVKRRVFCASMADVFEDYQGPDREKLLVARETLQLLILNTPNLIWLLLTKRPENILGMLHREFVGPWPANAWLGTTVENQEQADKRIPELLKVPAKVRFLSCEPLLGPVDLGHATPCGYYCQQPTAEDEGRHIDHQFFVPGIRGGICWVICGGESGPGARPMHPNWARSLRDQCQAASVPFFFKQWGDWLPWEFDGQEFNDVIRSQAGHELWNDEAPRDPLNLPKGWDYFEDMDDPTGTLFQHIGKHKAGRLLDGREWSDLPSALSLKPSTFP